MKQKKKKKIKLNQKVLQQHKKAKRVIVEKTYADFKSLKDIKQFILHNLDFLLLLAIIVVAVYFNAMNGAFISDDVPGYVNNQKIRDFGTALSTFHWQEIVYSIFFAVFKLNPTPLHIMSMVFHYLAVVSFFIFIANLFSKKVSMFAALIFSIHPITAEIVAWISAINYPLFAISTFWASTLYLLFRKTKEKKYLWSSVGIFGIVLFLTKASQALTIFPIIIVIDQFFLEKKLTWKNAKHLAWYLLPVGIFLLGKATKIVYRVETVSTTLTGGEAASYLTSLPFSIYMTVRLMFFPDKLSLYHDSIPVNTVFMAEMYTVLVGLGATVVYTWRHHRRIAGLLLVGIASFAYMLSPVQVSWFFAERYVYLATSMFSVLLILLFIRMERKTKVKNLSLILLVISMIAFSTRTFIRNNDWKTRKSLWEATLREVPLSSRTYNNLGDVYAVEGNLQKSAEAFQKAIELKPNYADATHNLGYTYYLMEELDLAEEYFKKSLELNPNIAPAYLHLAMVEYKRENMPQVKAYLEKALEIDPNYTQVQQLLKGF